MSDTAVSPVQDKAFTLDDFLRAVEHLKRANIPQYEGYYSFAMHPVQLEEMRLWEMLTLSPVAYRVELHARAILRYEQRRKRCGRREDWPTAKEAFARAWRVS